jgi:hypothetical protein
VHWLNAALIVWGRTFACMEGRDASDEQPDRSSDERWLHDETTRGLADLERYLAHRVHRS